MQPRGNNAPADVAWVQTGLSVINTFACLRILLGRNVGQLPAPDVAVDWLVGLQCTRNTPIPNQLTHQ